MLTPQQTEYLKHVYESAKTSGHIFPGAAAAVAALESNWGTSKLALVANNLFGLKKSSTWAGRTVEIPTKEYIRDAWVTVNAVWPVYDSWQECFSERMKVLKKSPSMYSAALSATNPEEFIKKVSLRWATDPLRGMKVISIYRNHLDILGK